MDKDLHTTDDAEKENDHATTFALLLQAVSELQLQLKDRTSTTGSLTQHTEASGLPSTLPLTSTLQDRYAAIYREGFLEEDDPRFIFSTYTDVPLDGLAKTAARTPWSSFKEQHPASTMELHFQHVVHWATSAKLEMGAFCRMAAPLYGNMALFLWEQSISGSEGCPFETPVAFYNSCISMGHSVPSVTDIRNSLESLSLRHHGDLAAYCNRFFDLLSDYKHYPEGKEYRENRFATSQLFLRGFSAPFRTLVQDEAVKTGLNLSDTPRLVATVRKLWVSHPNHRYIKKAWQDRPGYKHKEEAVVAHHSIPTAPHAGGQKLTTPLGSKDPWKALSPKEKDDLRAIHAALKAGASLTNEQTAWCRQHKACHLCGRLSHLAGSCPRNPHHASQN